MRKKRMWISVAIGFCLLCLGVFRLRFPDAPAKRPPDRNPGTENEILDQSNNIALAKDNGEEQRLSEGPDIANIFVRDIPVALDQEMEEHLSEFRKKAKRLQQNYPDSFRIAIPTTKKTVALTFDDGPDDSSTPKVIEILNSYGIPGTFFFIGQQMDRYPETVEAAQAGGHVIANHSWSHIRPTDADREAFLKEVRSAQDALSRFGTETKLFRPPYGLVNEDQMPALIDAGFKAVAWSVDSMDWYFDDPEDIVTCVVKSIHPGAIVLMHSSGGPSNRQATIDALPVIIETLRDQGYRFVALTQ